MSQAITLDPSERTAEAERDTDCPNCGAGLTNVQGIDACTGCTWTDV